MRQLPSGLIQAFHSTLRDAVSADVILHLYDSSSECCDAEQRHVRESLMSLGLPESRLEQIVEVGNKCDIKRLAPPIVASDTDTQSSVPPEMEAPAVCEPVNEEDLMLVSVHDGTGMPDLIQLLRERVMASRSIHQVTFRVPLDGAKQLDWLRREATLLETKHANEKGVDLFLATALINQADINKFFTHFRHSAIPQTDPVLSTAAPHRKRLKPKTRKSDFVSHRSFSSSCSGAFSSTPRFVFPLHGALLAARPSSSFATDGAEDGELSESSVSRGTRRVTADQVTVLRAADDTEWEFAESPLDAYSSARYSGDFVVPPVLQLNRHGAEFTSTSSDCNGSGSDRNLSESSAFKHQPPSTLTAPSHSHLASMKERLSKQMVTSSSLPPPTVAEAFVPQWYSDWDHSLLDPKPEYRTALAVSCRNYFRALQASLKERFEDKLSESRFVQRLHARTEVSLLPAAESFEEHMSRLDVSRQFRLDSSYHDYLMQGTCNLHSGAGRAGGAQDPQIEIGNRDFSYKSAIAEVELPGGRLLVPVCRTLLMWGIYYPGLLSSDGRSRMAFRTVAVDSYPSSDDHRVDGKEPSATVVAVHGLLSDHRTFYPIMTELKRKHNIRTVAINLPDSDFSSGLSNECDRYFMQRLSWRRTYLQALLSQLDISQVDMLLGHSIGCLVALDIAAKEPLVRSFCLVAPHPHKLSIPNERFMKHIQAIAAASSGPISGRIVRRLVSLAQNFYPKYKGFTVRSLVETAKVTATLDLEEIKVMANNIRWMVNTPVLFVEDKVDPRYPPGSVTEFAKLMGFQSEEFRQLDESGAILKQGVTLRNGSLAMQCDGGGHNPHRTHEKEIAAEMARICSHHLPSLSINSRTTQAPDPKRLRDIVEDS